MPALGDNNLKAGRARHPRRRRRRARGGFRAVPRRVWAPPSSGWATQRCCASAAELAVAAATAAPPAHALDRLRPAFEHRNWRARVGAPLPRPHARGPVAARRRPPPSRGACSCSRCSRTASRPSARPPSSPSSRQRPQAFGAIRRTRRTFPLTSRARPPAGAPPHWRRPRQRPAPPQPAAVAPQAAVERLGLRSPRARRGRRLRLQRSARPAEAGHDAALAGGRRGPRRRRRVESPRWARRRRWTRARRWSRRWFTRARALQRDGERG